MTLATQSSDGWFRLHPLTILKELGALAWALAAAIFFDFDFGLGAISDRVNNSENVIAIGVFAFAVTRYWFTSYRVTPEAVELKRGVLVRSFQSMPRQRIQSVGTKTGLFARIVGVTTVEISAADAEDIELSYVSESAAENLQLVLAADRVESKGSEDGASISPLARLNPSEIILFGLTEPGIGFALVVLGVAIALSGVVGWLAAPLATAGVLIVPLIRTVALVDFKSWIENDSVKVESGLLSRRKSAAPRKRIQAIQVNRPLVRRLFGFETTTIVTGDVAVDTDSLVGAGMISPLAVTGSWTATADALIGKVNLAEDRLARSSRLTVRRAAIRGGAVVLLIGMAVAIAGELLAIGWLVPVVAIALVGAGAVMAYAVARWISMGWSVDADHLMVRRGVLTRRITVVPIGKVQDVTVRATFFQRRLGLATVEVDTAGVSLAGSVVAIDLKADVARALALRLAGGAAKIALPDGV